MIPSKYNINSSNLVSLSLPKDDYFSKHTSNHSNDTCGGSTDKETKHRHSQPDEENTIFPSRTLIQDSMVQSSVAFQYPLPWQHNATSPTVSRLVTAFKHAASCLPLSITIYSPDYTHKRDHHAAPTTTL